MSMKTDHENALLIAQLRADLTAARKAFQKLRDEFDDALGKFAGDLKMLSQELAAARENDKRSADSAAYWESYATQAEAELAAAREALAELAYLSRNRTTTRIMLRDHIAAALAAAKEGNP